MAINKSVLLLLCSLSRWPFSFIIHFLLWNKLSPKCSFPGHKSVLLCQLIIFSLVWEHLNCSCVCKIAWRLYIEILEQFNTEDQFYYSYVTSAAVSCPLLPPLFFWFSCLCFSTVHRLSLPRFLSGNLSTRPSVHGDPDCMWHELPGSQGGHTQRPRRQELRVSVPDPAQHCRHLSLLLPVASWFGLEFNKK